MTRSIDSFNDKLVQLVGASIKVNLAAAMAMANPSGIDDLGRRTVSDRIKVTIENLRQLQVELEAIGRKGR